MPSVAHLPEDAVVGDEHVVGVHLVEVVLAGHQADGADRQARGGQLDEQLGQAAVAVAVGPGRAHEHDQEVAVVGPAGPELGAGHPPAAVDPHRPGADGRQVGPGVGLAHPDGDEAVAGRDAGRNVLRCSSVPYRSSDATVAREGGGRAPDPS